MIAEDTSYEKVEGVLEPVYIIVKTHKMKRVNNIDLQISDGFEIVQGYAERDEEGLRTDHTYTDNDVSTFDEYINYLVEFDIRQIDMYNPNYVFETLEKAEKVLASLLAVLVENSPTNKFEELSKKYPEALI